MTDPSNFKFEDSPSKAAATGPRRTFPGDHHGLPLSPATKTNKAPLLPQRSMDDLPLWVARPGAVAPTAMRRVVFLGHYPPMQTGAAVFTQQLRAATKRRFPTVSCLVCMVTTDDLTDALDAAADDDSHVRFDFHAEDTAQYHRLADYINASRVDVVCMQFARGMYGGDGGQHILAFMKVVRPPVVTLLYSIPTNANVKETGVLGKVLSLSSGVIAMTRTTADAATSLFGVPAERLKMIPCGILECPYINGAESKETLKMALDLNLPTKTVPDAAPPLVILSCGLISPRKGIEWVLEALPLVVQKHPNVLYVVVGPTSQHQRRQHGEAYRHTLEFQAASSGVADHVRFVNQFQSLDDLMRYVAAADVFVSMGQDNDQGHSCSLTMAFGSGTPVVATPFAHAKELIDDGVTGFILPADRSASTLANTLNQLLADPQKRMAVCEAARAVAATMPWSAAVEQMMAVLEEARLRPVVKGEVASLTKATVAEEALLPLPDINLDHLVRMTDNTGLIQFSIFEVPEYFSGYCTDDNARALTVCLKIAAIDRKLLASARASSGNGADLAVTYLAFLHAAFDGSINRFRNFMSYDRKWVDPDNLGSEESHGRAVQAAGHCCGYRFAVEVAQQLFLRSLPILYEFTSPRAVAHAMDGAFHFLKAFPNHEDATKLLVYGADMLLGLFRSVTERHLRDQDTVGEWVWFEDYLTYSNASLSMAMLNAGIALGRAEYLDCGLASLRWLFDMQVHRVTAHHNLFSPIGCQQAQLRGSGLVHPQHDQQPIEASTFVLAALTAFRHTRDVSWRDSATLAMEWFFGRNCVGTPLYDSHTGGCRDGLHTTGANDNQGAESMLSFLLALTDWKELDVEGKLHVEQHLIST